MIRKGQVHNVGGRDMQTQAVFIAGLFEVAARRSKRLSLSSSRSGICNRTVQVVQTVNGLLTALAE